MSIHTLAPKSLFQFSLALLTFLGALVPWYYNLQFIEINSGFSMERFIAQGFVNSASSSLSVDLGMSALAGVGFMIIEGRRLSMRFVWLYVISACLIAFAFAFPLFLYMREVYLNSRSSS